MLDFLNGSMGLTGLIELTQISITGLNYWGGSEHAGFAPGSFG
jgi:hypothetical protein